MKELTYTVKIRDEVIYSGPLLTLAIRTWDRQTYNAEFTPGGIEYTMTEGGLTLASGWLVHIQESGTVFINPRLDFPV